MLRQSVTTEWLFKDLPRCVCYTTSIVQSIGHFDRIKAEIPSIFVDLALYYQKLFPISSPASQLNAGPYFSINVFKQ